MKEKIILKGREVEYEMRKSYRASNLRISFDPMRGLAVTLPWLVGRKYAEKFLQAKAEWILKRFAEAEDQIIIKSEPNEYQKLKEAAREFTRLRVTRFNRLYNFSYNKIFIRNQKTRWGSCSSQKNLNYNYRIIKLPPNLADYIIVHELCHLQELNHSQNFWNLVAYTVPDYKELRREFRRIKII